MRSRHKRNPLITLMRQGAHGSPLGIRGSLTALGRIAANRAVAFVVARLPASSCRGGSFSEPFVESWRIKAGILNQTRVNSNSETTTNVTARIIADGCPPFCREIACNPRTGFRSRGNGIRFGPAGVIGRFFSATLVLLFRETHASPVDNRLKAEEARSCPGLEPMRQVRPEYEVRQPPGARVCERSSSVGSCIGTQTSRTSFHGEPEVIPTRIRGLAQGSGIEIEARSVNSAWIEPSQRQLAEGQPPEELSRDVNWGGVSIASSPPETWQGRAPMFSDSLPSRIEFTRESSGRESAFREAIRNPISRPQSEGRPIFSSTDGLSATLRVDAGLMGFKHLHDVDPVNKHWEPQAEGVAHETRNVRCPDDSSSCRWRRRLRHGRAGVPVRSIPHLPKSDPPYTGVLTASRATANPASVADYGSSTAFANPRRVREFRSSHIIGDSRPDASTAACNRGRLVTTTVNSGNPHFKCSSVRQVKAETNLPRNPTVARSGRRRASPEPGRPFRAASEQPSESTSPYTVAALRCEPRSVTESKEDPTACPTHVNLSSCLPMSLSRPGNRALLQIII